MLNLFKFEYKRIIFFIIIIIFLFGFIINLEIKLYNHSVYENLNDKLYHVSAFLDEYYEFLIINLSTVADHHKNLSTNINYSRDNNLFDKIYFQNSEYFDKYLENYNADNEKNNQMVISDVVTSMDGKNKVIKIILPIKNNENINTVIIGEIALNKFEQKIKKIIENEKIYITIFNDEKDILAHTRLGWKKITEERPSNKGIIVENILAGQTSFEFICSDTNLKYRCIALKSNTFPCYIAVYENINWNNELFEFLSSNILFIIIFIFLSIICTLNYKRFMQDVKIKEQEELFKKEKNMVISQLAATVAHEVRNPLTSVKGFIQLAKIKGVGVFTSEILEVMENDLERISKVITEFLQLSRPQIDLAEKINLRKLLKDIIMLIEPYALLNNVSIIDDLSETPCIIGDNNLLKQAFINLIKNAIEANDKDRGIVQISLRANDDKLEISIKDNGIGISKESMGKIGTPFYTTKTSGTGLGLTVSLNKIKKHNGKIKINSEEGKGTEFIIEFPII